MAWKVVLCKEVKAIYFYPEYQEFLHGIPQMKRGARGRPAGTVGRINPSWRPCRSSGCRPS